MAMPVGRLVFDSSWNIVDANAAAGVLLRSTDMSRGRRERIVPGGCVLPQEMARPGVFPCSRYRLWRLADGHTQGFLLHYATHGSHYVVRFEPADWTLGFVDQLQGPVATLDEQGLVVYVNGATLQLLGLTAEGVLGRRAVEVAKGLAVRAGDAEAIGRLAAGAEVTGDALDVRLPSRGQTRLHYRLSPWFYRGCRCGTILSLFEDPEPEEVKRQAALAVAYRLGAMYQHEFRNPLQTIQAAVDLLRTRESSPSPQLLRVIEEQVHLISDYLADQAQAAQGSDLTIGRLSHVVEAEIERSRLRLPTRLLQFRHRRMVDEPPVRLHAGSLGRVFANLFRNSAQARADATVSVGYSLSAGTLTCVVEDDGPGFPPHMLGGRWLAPENDGTRRLGLFVAASTAEAHGGTVAVGNRTCGGAYVRISLPSARPPDVADRVAAGAEAGGTAVSLGCP